MAAHCLRNNTLRSRSSSPANSATTMALFTPLRQIATKWLDWNTLGPLVQKYQTLIVADVKTDTRRLDDFDAFQNGMETLKTFAAKRQAYLLNYK